MVTKCHGRTHPDFCSSTHGCYGSPGNLSCSSTSSSFPSHTLHNEFHNLDRYNSSIFQN
ncbi:hypothetical protein Tsubulata_009678 [Turnera subulata]|uniref:Uncharacterized protein n=1 Tax=Turnera subulata TaxID=218843 RepID=A0A9Q0GG39_9ROSI|nr:hypothetical protein Tsubulata_009678 [Turnera subulata]